MKKLPTCMIKSCFIIAALMALTLIISCTNIPSNIGKSYEVVVAASSIDSSMIIDNVQLYNYVPQKEGLFTFLFKADTAIKQFNRYHTIIIYGTLEDESIGTLLNDDAKLATKKDTFTLFKLNDLWAREQLVVIMAVSEPVYISRGIEKYRNIISDILEENYYQRIKKNYYYRDIDKKHKKTLEKFGVTFDLTKSWMIDSTYWNENFLFFHTHLPDRSIFFYKEPVSHDLSRTMVIEKRNALTAKYYNGDYILNDLVNSEKIEYKDMKGLKLKGVWQNDSLVAGGPFISYFLTDDDTLFIIDAVLFNPGKRKSDYFTTLEVIMNSFQLVKRKPE
ncbi:MAG: DUF4837 family protein [bacterium]